MKKFVIGALLVGLIGLAGATADDKAGPTGTWKWTVERNGQTREVTLKLKADGGKLTGTVTTGKDNTETKIEDGTFKDGTVAFAVTREWILGHWFAAAIVLPISLALAAGLLLGRYIGIQRSINRVLREQGKA